MKGNEEQKVVVWREEEEEYLELQVTVWDAQVVEDPQGSVPASLGRKKRIVKLF